MMIRTKQHQSESCSLNSKVITRTEDTNVERGFSLSPQSRAHCGMRWLAICCLSCLLCYSAVEGKQLGTSAPAFIWGSASHLPARENGQKHWVSYEVLALFAPCYAQLLMGLMNCNSHCCCPGPLTV